MGLFFEIFEFVSYWKNLYFDFPRLSWFWNFFI